MTNAEVERALGCTPCVCGALDTWHAQCYAGKSQDEIDAGYKRAFAKARRNLKTAAWAAARAAVGEARE